MLTSPGLFEHMQRVAKVFCASTLVPAHLKGNNGADAFLALHIARQRGEDPVAVMQNIYFVQGKAGWLTTYMISRANKSGAFKGRIKWRTVGKGEEMEVTAFAIAADDGTECSATVSMAMAIGEGWARNAKYKTMQEHMLKWRSATMLIRLYCPEVMSGMRTADELEDMQDITDQGSASVPEPKRAEYVADDTPAAETWELFDEVGELLGEFEVEDWANKLTGASMQLIGKERAQLLDNNKETARIIWEHAATADQTAAHLEAIFSTPPEPTETKVNWRVEGVIGEPAIIKAIKDLIDTAPRDVDVQAIIEQNGDRLGKMSAMKRDGITQHAEAKIEALKP
jgi:hypothetical protein